MIADIATRVLTAGPDAVAAAAVCLRGGGLVAFPTETVYGLGADAGNATAIARLYEAKGRPAFNPLIAHVHDRAAARALAHFDAAADKLAEAFWPGPLTLVLPKRHDCPVAELATAGLDTIALRIPDHALARDILRAFGGPVVAPSANRSGHVSPTTAAHVRADLGGRIDLIVDGGPTRMGLESTIVACVGEPMLLRPGALPRTEIERVLGRNLSFPVRPRASGDPVLDSRSPLRQSEAALASRRRVRGNEREIIPTAPGQLASHYAPRARLRLDAREVRDGEALLAFGPTELSGAARAVRILNLSPSGDLIEAAANLFSHLRALDASGAATIAAMPVPHDGLGEAINDRLRRAAAPRG